MKMKITFIVLSAMLIAYSQPARVHAQTIAADQLTYLPGDPITFNYTGGTGDPKDWIGIYEPGQTPGVIGSTLWSYISFPNANYTFSNTSVLQPGQQYIAYLFCCDGYSVLATSDTFQITGQGIISRLTYYRTDDTLVFRVLGTLANSSVKVYSSSDFTGGVLNGGAVPEMVQQVGIGTNAVADSNILLVPYTATGSYVALLVSSDGVTEEGRDTFQIWTKPAIPSALNTIAYGSCGKQLQPQPNLDNAISRTPDLFIYLGDNLYIDSYDTAVLKQSYEAFIQGRPEFQRLRASVPLLATWDDHDYGCCDEDKDYPYKQESQRYFLHFWEEPDTSARHLMQGIYTSYYYGSAGQRVQVILLDTRYWLDDKRPNTGGCGKNDYCPWDTPQDMPKTILGKAQWKWLEQELQQPADFRIIGSSIQFGIEYNGWEGWTNFPYQRLKMCALIKKHQANHVVFLSGDVHYTELSAFLDNQKNTYTLYDHTASAINQIWSPIEPNSYRVNNFSSGVKNFGALQLDWAGKAFTMNSYDENNSVIYSHTVKMDSVAYLTNQKPDLASNQSLYNTGDTMVFTFTNSTGYNEDVIALFKKSDWDAGNILGKAVLSQSIGGQQNGTVKLSPATIGTNDYVAAIICCDGEFDLDTVNFKVNNPIGIPVNVASNATLVISPNPVENLLQVSVDKQLLNSTLEIIDVLGKVVYTYSIAQQKFSLELNKLQKGIYFCRIKTHAGDVVRKFTLR